MEMNIFSIAADVILAAIGIGIVVRSYRVGFMRTAVLAIGYVAAVLVAIWAGRLLAPIAYDMFLRDMVQTSVDQAVAGSVEGLSFELIMANVFDALPAFLINPVLASFGGEEAIIQGVRDTTDGVVEQIGSTVADSIVAPVATEILRIIICLLIFVICVIIVRGVASLFGKLYAIPIVGTINSVLGAVLGLVKAAVVLALLAAAVMLIISITGNRLSWLNTEIVNSTFLLKPLCQLVV